jgi:hypothetical protein
MRIVESGAKWHRIAEVMEQERVSPRAAALRMNLTQSQVQAEANPASDLRISDLYRWQAALEVPLAEMLREPGNELSPQVRFRSSLLKIMRTVRSLQDHTDGGRTRNLVMTLAGQLLELMPELKHVSAWPVFGQRRRSEEMGAIADKRVSDDFFVDSGWDI